MKKIKKEKGLRHLFKIPAVLAVDAVIIAITLALDVAQPQPEIGFKFPGFTMIAIFYLVFPLTVIVTVLAVVMTIISLRKIKKSDRESTYM